MSLCSAQRGSSELLTRVGIRRRSIRELHDKRTVIFIPNPLKMFVKVRYVLGRMLDQLLEEVGSMHRTPLSCGKIKQPSFTIRCLWVSVIPIYKVEPILEHQLPRYGCE